MVRTIAASSAAELEAFCGLTGGAQLQPARLDGDEHLVTLRGDAPQARCSLWWRATPALDDQRLGYIGHFAACSDTDNQERAATAARGLLADACRRLAERGCTRAVGPIDGSTWHRYRLVTERGDEPPFFLEPDNPDEWPVYFRDAGFAPLAHYTSASDLDLRRLDPRAADVAERMHALDVCIREIDPQQFASEVDRIFDVSLVSFRSAFLYSPIDRAQCRLLYEPLAKFIKPELVLIAERGEAPVGFVFAIPDWLQAQRGAAVDTVIVKTIAILPDPAYSGLGGLLLARCRERIVDLGYARAVHALMFDGNVGSRRLSDRFGATMRGYTLFARPIARS